MRRNLVGKKKPQQPKIRWSDTFNLDAGSLTGAQLKAIRDANSDLPVSSDVHWTEIADGSTNQFKKGDHMALSSAFISQRQNTMTTPTLTSQSMTAGTVSLERSSLAYLPAAGGSTVADMSIVDVGGGGSIVDGPDGGVVVSNGSGTITKVGVEATGTVTYGSKSNFVGSNEYFRARIKISNLTLTQGQVILCGMNNSSILTNVEITEEGVHTIYGRFIGNGKVHLELRMCLNAPGHSQLGGCSMTLDYFHLDIVEDIGLYRHGSSRADNKTATSSNLLIGVRANGATAYTTAYDSSISAGYQRGLYQDVLVSTAYNWGRSSDLRPGHEESYVVPAGNVTDDGWYALPRLAFLPIEDVWADLYANNSGIGPDVDPTAEWFIAHDVPLHSPSWTSATQTDLGNSVYEPIDAWVKDCDVQQQTSVAAVSAPTWDNNWKRAHSGYSLFARNTTDNTSAWEYENFDSADFSDEPNDFTLDARGIVLGAQQFFELCDDADGSQADVSGTTEAFRGARGKILVNGNDFTVLAAGDEFVASYGSGPSREYTNAPATFEWRMVTFIGEAGQEGDITSSSIDTENSALHWSHSGGVFGFVN